MAKNSFLLVSLQENKAKELAQVISNNSCRTILDYLSQKEHATESDISKKLGLPISTVHYNLQQLMKASIITVDEFHYSEKGKEVNHYKLANKYIIIAPKTTYGIKEKLRSILPISLFALIGAGIIQAFTMFSRRRTFSAIKAAPAVMEAAKDSAEPLRQAVMGEAAEEGARAVMEEAPQVAAQVVQAAPNYALWFLVGSLFVILLIIVFELIRSRREK